MTESWTNWEGEVINRSFALRRYLGGSEHSGVFLTDRPEHELKAAIKLVPVDPAMAEARVANWRSVATLSHPHLMRVFDAGQVTRAGQCYVFVVMEYADETLAELLPQRALSADEARAMLPPVLDALAFLHGRNLVLGQVKPSNIVVVQDQVKLAADTVQPPGRLAGVTASVYAAPEARGGQFSRASDVWSLGITIIEALTRHPPSSADGRPGVASLSAELPRDFVSLVVRCLNPNPSVRPSPQQLKAWITGDANGAGAAGALSPEAFGGTGQAATREPAAAAPERVTPVTPLPAPVRGHEPAAPPRHQSPPQGSLARRRASAVPRHSFGPYVAAAVVLALVWAGSRLLHGQHPVAKTAGGASPAEPSPAPLLPGPAAPAPEALSPAPAVVAPPASARSDIPGVLHQVPPLVARSAADTIRGRFGVVVRVTVNRSGNVVDESLEDAGPSKYFARVASAAARQWTFVPDSQSSRQWLLRFEFSRDQTSATAEAVAPP
ncbi:MAG: protein kinase [Steroidobacteraceae bacterium]